MKNYLSEDGYLTVANATRKIVEMYNTVDRQQEDRIYRTILELAKTGEYGGRKYKNSNGRLWEINEEVISYIEEKFKLTIVNEKVERRKTETSTDETTLTVIKKLIASCNKNILTYEQFFKIVEDLIYNEGEQI